MKEAQRNIWLNSENLSPIEKIKTEVINSKENPILSNMDIFEKNNLFKKQSLNKGEYLIKSWEIDNNLYFVKSWTLSVEKQISDNKSRQLWIIKTWEFVWEWWFSKDVKKEVSVLALSKVEVLKIDLIWEFKKFMEFFPELSFEILKFIILETNKRLSEVNRLFTASSEIEEVINNLKKVDWKSIFNLIEKIKDIVDSDYILYFEKHEVINDILTLKYDSRTPWKILDIIFERKWYFLDLDELYEKANIWKDDQVIINKVSIWEEVYGFLILWREKRTFSFWDKKIISWISNSLSGVIKKYLQDKENKNKVYITQMKNN